MNFDYQPITEDQAQRIRYQLLEDGYYRAHVDQSFPKVSKTGNPMAELELSVFDKNNNPNFIKDYLPFTENMMWKMIHFCHSANLQEEYKAKQFTPQLARNQNVIVLIGMQKGAEIPFDKLKGKLPGSCYPDKNIVLDYVTEEFYLKITNQDKIESKKEEPFFDDDIAF